MNAQNTHPQKYHVGLRVLHVAAALKHLLFDKLNLFKRIA